MPDNNTSKLVHYDRPGMVKSVGFSTEDRPTLRGHDRSARTHRKGNRSDNK